MAPHTRFTSSPVGPIAYTVVGTGPTLLVDGGWVTHLEHMRRHPGWTTLVESLARSHRVVCFDRPGCGLSGRDRTDHSPQSEMQVLAALLDLAAGPASIFASSMGVPAAISLAADRPDDVDKLVLWGGAAAGEQLAPVEVRDALPQLIRSSWGLGSTTLAGLFLPGESRPSLDWFADLQRVAADGDTAARLLEWFYATDVRPKLSAVQAPTLVVHRRDDRAVPASASREIAESIQGAMLVHLEGDAHPAYMGDVDAVVEAVGSFLGTTEHDDLLSLREREVAELVAEGMTNAEIGGRLHISPRTVETHIANIRSKLDVRSRAQIATWVASGRS